MNKTFTSSEVREFVAQWREHALTVSEKFAVMAMISAYADRLEADEKTQAQRGVWVLVPREPTEGMLKAAEDAVDAASNCESTTDDLSAIAYKAALAAAPQPQTAKPVATVEDQFGFPIMEWIGDAGEKCPVGTNLYTHPAQAQPPAASVTDAMVERAQDCLHGNGKDIGYYHMRAALEAALAAAPQQQAAEPVASVGRYPGGGPRLDLLVPPDRAPPEGALLYARAATPHVERMTEALRNLCAEMASVAKERGVSRDQVNTYRWCKRQIMAIVADHLTKTHPQPAQDAKDAARYRWLRDKSGRAGSPYIRCDDPPFKPMAYWITAGTADSCIDRAMAKESGNG